MYPAAKKYSKKIITIIIHLMIHRLNTTSTFLEKINEFCSMFVRETDSHPKLLTLDTKVAILYNCLKTLIGIKSINKRT